MSCISKTWHKASFDLGKVQINAKQISKEKSFEGNHSFMQACFILLKLVSQASDMAVGLLLNAKWYVCSYLVLNLYI